MLTAEQRAFLQETLTRADKKSLRFGVFRTLPDPVFEPWVGVLVDRVPGNDECGDPSGYRVQEWVHKAWYARTDAIVEVFDKVVSRDEEMQALRDQLDMATRRAQVAEKQLNDVVMAASIKLATARMVLSQMKDSQGLIGAAIQGVLDALPKEAIRQQSIMQELPR